MASHALTPAHGSAASKNVQPPAPPVVDPVDPADPTDPVELVVPDPDVVPVEVVPLPDPTVVVPLVAPLPDPVAPPVPDVFPSLSRLFVQEATAAQPIVATINRARAGEWKVMGGRAMQMMLP